MMFLTDCLSSHAKRLGRAVTCSPSHSPVVLASIGLICLSNVASAAPDPASADLPGIAPLYRSAFAGYRGWQDQTVQPWLRSNDAAARAGGWRTYAREAAGAAAREGAAPAVPPAAPPSFKPSAQQQPSKGPAHVHQ